ncbi:acyl-CoA dehydrogenase family protein [Pseudonocardia alni]|uniref:acyl-CoA dehydrogenase family protein n=1 Tax=Pseudonocardia alni TaxID=33907 RepID=UPI0027DB8205|nr:acyl-CoA dehydrogenase family protein [Pseudonocardia alni]
MLRHDRAGPGAGSDPDALRTTASQVDGGWRIDGRKWFVTGADGAAFTIVMARSSGEPGDRGGATMFVVDADNAGMTVGRHIPTLGESLYGGHLEVQPWSLRERPAGPVPARGPPVPDPRRPVGDPPTLDRHAHGRPLPERVDPRGVRSTLHPARRRPPQADRELT